MMPGWDTGRFRDSDGKLSPGNGREVLRLVLIAAALSLLLLIWLRELKP